MIDFSLSDQQKAIRGVVRAFASEHLQHARNTYDAVGSDPHDRFRSTRPIYEAAVQSGLIAAQIPQALGGTGGTLLDAAVVVEEMYAVETSASLTILGTGLGLTPLIVAASSEMQKKFFGPFLNPETDAAPLASLVFSEPAGSANFASATGTGFGTVAVQDGDSFTISGEKIWATNHGGWDERGADVQTVCCRVPGSGSDIRSQVAIIVVTREDIAANEPGTFTVVSHPDTLGHTAVNGPLVKFNNLRVPKSNLLAPPGMGADVIDATFTGSAALVCAMGVGIMRHVFEYTLAWAKSDRRGGHETMLEKQSVADLLIKIKTRCEAARALCWKACWAFSSNPAMPEAMELCYEAKIFGSECAVESVMDGINLVGVSAYSKTHPLAYLLQDATVLPIFDGGNVGVRRRQIERIFAMPQYDAWRATFT